MSIKICSCHGTLCALQEMQAVATWLKRQGRINRTVALSRVALGDRSVLLVNLAVRNLEPSKRSYSGFEW